MTQESSNVQALARDGEVLRLRGQYRQALEKFDQVISVNPKSAWAYAHMGETYRQWGQPDNYYREARRSFEKAIELDPNYAWAYAHLGETYREMHEYRKAEECFKKAIQIDDKYAWAHAHWGANCYHRSRAESSNDPDLKDALEHLEKAQKLVRPYPWARVYEAIVHSKMRNYEDSFYALIDAVTHDPKILKSTSKNIGMLKEWQDEFESALNLYDQAVKENPSDIEIKYYRIGVIVKLKGLEPALSQIKELRNILESDTPITAEELNKYYMLGGLAALEGDKAQAMFNLNAALSYDPKLKTKALVDAAWDNVQDEIVNR